jgi:hypothetical protein
MAGTTTRFAIPYATGADPERNWGETQSKAQADLIDALLYTGPAWVAINLSAGFAPQAGYATPAIRTYNGFVEFRGTVRLTTGFLTTTSALIFSAPAPGGTASGDWAVVLRAIGFDINTASPPYPESAYLNPRADGVVRVYASVAGKVNMIRLDGLRYAVV